MKSRERLAAIDASTPQIAAKIPNHPVAEMELMRLIRVVHLGMCANLDLMFRPFGLSDNSFHTLVLVLASERGALSPSLLCELVGQTRANMTRILRELTSKGLVYCVADEGDGRRKIVRITAKGRRQVLHIAPQLTLPAQVALSGLGNKERRVLQRLLRKLVVSLDQGERRSWKAA
jgi:MarR family transcriptional regulator, negative regulator of the multidrug operon emrRAB